MAGLVAIGLGALAILAIWGLTPLDRLQQFRMFTSGVRGDLSDVYGDRFQTSGPGVAVFALPVFAVARVFLSEVRAYDVASVACLLPLGAGAVAASRATGIVRRSARELLAVAAVVLGVPTLACYLEAFHPSDILATAACLGAFAAFARSRILLGAALLGLALATRQWALIALMVLAVLADPPDRLRVAGVALGTAVLITLPVAIAAPTATFEALAAKSVIRSQLTAPGLLPLPESGLYLLARYLPLVLVLGLCLWLYQRQIRFGPEVAVAALAAALLLRPLLDPGGFVYYLAPGYAFFVLLRPRSLRYPVLGLAGGVLLHLRARLVTRYPTIEGMVFNEGGRILPVGGALAVLTTVLIGAAAVAAVVELRDQT